MCHSLQRGCFWFNNWELETDFDLYMGYLENYYSRNGDSRFADEISNWAVWESFFDDTLTPCWLMWTNCSYNSHSEVWTELLYRHHTYWECQRNACVVPMKSLLERHTEFWVKTKRLHMKTKALNAHSFILQNFSWESNAKQFFVSFNKGR